MLLLHFGREPKPQGVRNARRTNFPGERNGHARAVYVRLRHMRSLTILGSSVSVRRRVTKGGFVTAT